MYREFFKFVVKFSQKSGKQKENSELEAYLDRKREIWDESLRYIQELSLTKP